MKKALLSLALNRGICIHVRPRSKYTTVHADACNTHTDRKDLGYLLPLKNNSFGIIVPSNTKANAAVFHPHPFTNIQFNFKGKLIYYLTLNNLFIEENGWDWFKRGHIVVACNLNSMSLMFDCDH